MDMMLKWEFWLKFFKYVFFYNFDELVFIIDMDGKDCGGVKDFWGFVRSWGWCVMFLV